MSGIRIALAALLCAPLLAYSAGLGTFTVNSASLALRIPVLHSLPYFITKFNLRTDGFL